MLYPAEGAKDDCYPARVHATLDLLDRHLATMKDQLTPKPPPGRVPPKKVVGFLICIVAPALCDNMPTISPSLKQLTSLCENMATVSPCLKQLTLVCTDQ